MGNWNITIEGVGPHGNLTHVRAADDAESVAARAVRDLTEGGHSVTHATVHAGGGRIEMAVHDDGIGRWVARSDGGAVTPIVENKQDLAANLYRVYCDSSGGKNFRGDPCPAWADLPDAIRGHWTAVAVWARR